MGRAFEYRKARKFKRWGNMARLFTRYGKEIAIAVKAGGPSPEANSRLRAIIQNARTDNVPKDNIERAIKKATSKDQEDYKEVTYEGYAPHGVAVFIETATDNTTRTVANIRSYFAKLGGSLATNGSVSFLFDKKCRFKIANKNYNIEELEFELIDFGAEEVFEVEDGIMVYGDFPAFGSLQKALEEKGCEILNAESEMIPNDFKELTEEQHADVDKLLERIEDDDDVQRVYTNAK